MKHNNEEQKIKESFQSKFIYILFAIALFIYLLVFTIESSTYSFQITNLPISKIYLFSIGVITVLGVFSLKNMTHFELLLFMLGYIVGILSYIFSHNLFGLICISIAFYSKEKNLKKIVQIYFWLIFFDLFFVIFSYFFNIIPAVSYTRDNFMSRASWGFLHPNTLALYILALNIAFYFIRSFNKISFRDIWFAAISLYITYFYPHSYTVAIILSSIIVFVTISSNKKKRNLKNKSIRLFKKYTFFKPLLVSLIVLLLCLLVIFVSRNSYNSFVSVLGTTIASRLLMGNLGLKMYGVSFLGQPVKFSDSSYIVLNNAYSLSYFTVDSLYIKLLINDGLAVEIMFLIIMLSAIVRSMETNKLIFLLLLGLLVYSIFETGLSSPILSFVFGYAFSKIESERKIG